MNPLPATIEETYAELARLNAHLTTLLQEQRPYVPQLNIQVPDEYSDTYDIIVDLRTKDDDANHDCSHALKGLYPTVTFDPEISCFYAYCPDYDTACKVASDIRIWLSENA